MMTSRLVAADQHKAFADAAAHSLPAADNFVRSRRKKSPVATEGTERQARVQSHGAAFPSRSWAVTTSLCNLIIDESNRLLLA